jgi:ribosomal protein S18 acetylase RimI-like enzyme
MLVRRLTPADSPAYRALRLAGLREAPAAFGSSYEEEKDHPLAVFEDWLAVKPDRGPFGAFDSDALVGIASLGRETLKKLSHKAFIWGMYVAPHARRKGTGRALLLEALAFARSVPEVRQVNLSVNANNPEAVRLYQAVGFKEFGREPGAMLVDDKLHDEIHMYLRVKP